MILERTQELRSVVHTDHPWYHVGGDDTGHDCQPSLAAIWETTLRLAVEVAWGVMCVAKVQSLCRWNLGARE